MSYARAPAPPADDEPPPDTMILLHRFSTAALTAAFAALVSDSFTPGGSIAPNDLARALSLYAPGSRAVTRAEATTIVSAFPRDSAGYINFTDLIASVAAESSDRHLG